MHGPRKKQLRWLHVLDVEHSAWRPLELLVFGTYSTAVTRHLALERGLPPRMPGIWRWVLHQSTSVDAVHFYTQTKQNGEIILWQKIFRTSRTMSMKYRVNRPSHKSWGSHEIYIRGGDHLPPPPPQSAKFHQTLNTSVLKEWAHSRTKKMTMMIYC